MNYRALNTKIASLNFEKKNKDMIFNSLIYFQPRLKPFLKTYIEEDLNERIKQLDSRNKFLKKIIEKEIALKNSRYHYLITKYCDVEPDDFLINTTSGGANLKKFSSLSLTIYNENTVEDQYFEKINKLYKMAKLLNPNSLAPLAYFLWRAYGRENEEDYISMP
ncbi:MAG: hypothetical protein FWF50_05625 [Defluviitaleaceae bacterium]|nr:hypothetical protein [Defluviitaleaceae bacterium]